MHMASLEEVRTFRLAPKKRKRGMQPTLSYTSRHQAARTQAAAVGYLRIVDNDARNTGFFFV